MSEPIPDLWDDAKSAALSEEDRLVLRSRLLGSDLRITNFGGGNTSAKVDGRDPVTGAPRTVLWVKGSGGDLGTIDRGGFATLDLGRILALRDRVGAGPEDALVPLLGHCVVDQNPRAPSIDTPLHAFVPKRHVDHLHPDGVIALATARDGEAAAREVFGRRIGWIPWKRPGFELGLMVAGALARDPALEGVVLAGHGLMTWADDAAACYRLSLEIINLAACRLAALSTRAGAPFGGPRYEALPAAARRGVAADVLPRLRGLLGRRERKIAHVADGPEVLEFVDSRRAAALSGLGTSCPDHFLRTKILPLFADMPPGPGQAGALAAGLAGLIESYRDGYAAYYERCRRPDSPPMRDPDPVVILVPGVGILTFAKDKTTARQASEFFTNAIDVMRGAELLGGYSGLSEREAFGIEYWPLEEAKLRRQPPEKSLSRRVALITGGAGGIGRATARRFLEERAAVVLVDVDPGPLAAAAEALRRDFGADDVAFAACDVTREDQVAAAVREAVLAFGGVDIAVLGAGLASAAPFEDTGLDLWRRNLDVLATGSFLVAREAFRVMKAQETGGSIVFVVSKNALAASPQASAYCTAKAAALHLARCVALEGAPLGIRANVVNPDAVLAGSRIWDGAWREERARAYGVEGKDLEEHYRQRSLLKRNVLPEDVAEAVWWFASERSSRSTGNILNVDAGNAQSFPR